MSISPLPTLPPFRPVLPPARDRASVQQVGAPAPSQSSSGCCIARPTRRTPTERRRRSSAIVRRGGAVMTPTPSARNPDARAL